MKFSLLYKNFDDSFIGSEGPLSEAMSDAVYDLSIDKAAWEFSRNSDSFNYFMEIIKKPLKSIEDIKYRQDVLLDFISVPKLLEELRLIFKSYDTLQSDWHEMRSSIYVYGVPNTARGILDCTYESLKVTANFAKNTVSYFRSIHDTIEKYEVKSEGLLGIKRFCAEMTENASLDEIARISAYFTRENIDAYEFRVRIESDNTLTITSSSLTEAIELEDKSIGKSFKKIFGNLGKTTRESDIVPEVDMGELHVEDANNILNEALYELYTALSGITGNIYEFFRGLSGELSFYDTGLRYCRRLSEARMPMCMPKMLPAESDCFKANDIYDMQLLEEGLTAEEITRNPVRFDENHHGMLIRGRNSGGKTCYLRAIAVAQIFAQAGLPVCASAANISIRNAVFAQFSSAEKEFSVGDIAGRFEGEVQEIAAIFDNIVPYSLVLLNETFQTTAYAEGSAGIKDILEIMPHVKSKYIFVTHLVQLFNEMDTTNIKMVELSSDEANIHKVKNYEA